MSAAMKLSEAIRAGAKLRPPKEGASHEYFQLRYNQWCSCALGAAAEAVDPTISYDVWRIYNTLREHWPELAASFDKNQVLQHALDRHISLEMQIVQWNDVTKLSREEIADKLEEMGY